MKIIMVASGHPACGQITITVNLARGLNSRGYKVLVGVLGRNERLRHWLDISPQGNVPEGGSPAKLFSSRLGIDLWELPSGAKGLPAADFSFELTKPAHDYSFLLPASQEDCCFLGPVAETLIVCTDLAATDELEELKSIEELWRNTRLNNGGIDLIIPNKINTKEWEHNIEKLSLLADYFGYERIADPIPT